MSFKTDKLRRLAVDFQSFRERLELVVSDGGQFKDYKYEFSNISLLIKNISYICELLSYHINTTASEASIDMTKTYKAINAIADKFGYSPTGTMAPSATVDVSLMFSNIATSGTSDWYSGSYLAIPKYTAFPTSAVTPYLNLEKSKEKITYCTTKDWYFPMTTVFSSAIAGSGSVSGAYWKFDTPMEVYNGEFMEASGDGNGQPFQVCVLNNSTVTKEIAGVTITNRHHIDYRFIDVYVYDTSLGTYVQWKRVDSLSDRLPVEKIYEVHVNGNSDYEVRFGDGVNGAIPTSGVNTIHMKYLLSNMELGEMGSNMLVPFSSFFVTSDAYVRTRNINGKMISVSADSSYWSSARAVIPDVIQQNNVVSYTDNKAVYDIKLEQPRASSRAVYAEPVFSMKDKILDFSRFTGKRLGNERAFEAFVASSLSDYIQTSYAMNNTEYMNTVMAEMVATSGYHTATEDVSGMESPYDEYFQTPDSTFFNNLYLFIVPKNTNSIIHPNRETILKKLYDSKMLCSNVNVVNPIYAHLAFYIKVQKDERFKQDVDIIRNRIRKYMTTAYSKTNMKFGNIIDLGQMKRDIEGITGISAVNTIMVFEKDYYDFTASDITGIMADPINYDDSSGVIAKRNFTFKPGNYKFPVLNTAFINNDSSIIVEQVGENNLPSLDIV